MILINTTGLSNVTVAQVTPLLAKLCGVKALATDEVLGEFAIGVDHGSIPAASLKWLTRVKLRGRRDAHSSVR